MNKLSMFLSFCLVFVLFSSCAPDLTDDVERAYDRTHYSDYCTAEGAFRCEGNVSQRCEQGRWRIYEYCDLGCEYGKCKTEPYPTDDPYVLTPFFWTLVNKNF